MSEILDTAVAFPTVVYTIAFGICLVYWLFVMLGALDIDLFDGVDGGSDGFDFDVGGGHGGHGDFGGGHGGHADLGGGHGGHGEVGADGHGHDGHHGHGLFGALSALGLGRVPMTVAASAVLFFTWAISLVLSSYASRLHGDLSNWVFAPIVFVFALVLGTIIAAFAVRPLGPVFEVQTAKTRRDYVGSICEITTGRVDDRFGQATITDGGTVLVIPVRCDAGANKLERGGSALVIDYDDQREAYVVEPYDRVMDAGK